MFLSCIDRWNNSLFVLALAAWLARDRCTLAREVMEVTVVEPVHANAIVFKQELDLDIVSSRCCGLRIMVARAQEAQCE